MEAFFGLLKRVPPEHPTCRRIPYLTVVEAWRCCRPDSAVAAFTIQLAFEHETNPMVRDLLAAWRRLASGTGDEENLLVKQYSDEDRWWARQLISVAKRCGVVNRRAVVMRRDWWVVRPVRSEGGPEYMRGAWLELFASLVAWRSFELRQAAPLSEPLTRVRLADKRGDIAYELDMVMPLPAGRLLLVEAKTGDGKLGPGAWVEYAIACGIRKRYRVFLTGASEAREMPDYIQLGPSAFCRYLQKLLPIGRRGPSHWWEST